MYIFREAIQLSIDTSIFHCSYMNDKLDILTATALWILTMKCSCQ